MQFIIARTTDEVIIPVQSMDFIVASKTADDIIPVGPLQIVAPSCACDRAAFWCRLKRKRTVRRV
ncbi:MAG: hypothetical protein WD276_00895 [Actinomycetota bacterium]